VPLSRLAWPVVIAFAASPSLLTPSAAAHSNCSLHPDGATEAIMLAHGFTVEMLVDLVRAGLATAKSGRVVAGGRTIEVARVRITEAGRETLSTLQGGAYSKGS
jgi:hypothetical protein